MVTTSEVSPTRRVPPFFGVSPDAAGLAASAGLLSVLAAGAAAAGAAGAVVAAGAAGFAGSAGLAGVAGCWPQAALSARPPESAANAWRKPRRESPLRAA